jgi:hypothetical protein
LFDTLISFSLREKTQEIQLWDEHGESSDATAIIEKLKKEIVVPVFSGFASGSCKGLKLSKITIILPY